MQVTIMKPLSDVLPGSCFLYSDAAYHRLDAAPTVGDNIAAARLDTGSYTSLPATLPVLPLSLKVVPA